MAIVYSLSTKANPVDGKHEVLMRLYHGKINQRGKTGIFGPAQYWDSDKQRFALPKTRRRIHADADLALADMITSLNSEIAEIERYVLEEFRKTGSGRAGIPDKWLANTLTDRMHKDHESKCLGSENQFLDAFEKYLAQKDISASRKNHFLVNLRELQRFAAYQDTELSFSSIDSDFLHDFDEFLANEHTLLYIDEHKHMVFANANYEKAYAAAPESRPPKMRSRNTIIGKMTRLHSFMIWARIKGYIEEDPFDDYTIGSAMYGTPIYPSAEERDALYRADLSNHPELAVQRDIFVLQCFIGCRIGDYYRMTKSNYYDEAIHYIPSKTARGALITVHLVNPIPREILNRYSDMKDNRLMPFIAEQAYNRDIKTVFRMAGLDRMVTILDPQTRQEKQCPLWEVASSHMARRAFVGNLFKKVKDPNLIAKVSGHVENSRSFARYRTIDEEDAKELLSEL